MPKKEVNQILYELRMMNQRDLAYKIGAIKRAEDPKCCRKISEARNKEWSNKSYRDQRIEAIRKGSSSLSARKAKSIASKRMWSENRKGILGSIRKGLKDYYTKAKRKEYSARAIYYNSLPITRKLRSEKARRQWKDQKFRSLALEGSKRGILKALKIQRESKVSLFEKRVAFKLRKLGYRIQTQKPIKEIPTLVDIYLPSLKLCIYCDGTYWHSLPSYIERDRRQNKLLKKMGYDVVRIREKFENKDLERMVSTYAA